MLKLTLYHTPAYFQFYICDEGASTGFLLNNNSQEKIEKFKYASSDDLISIAVVSEYSEVPIKVEYSDDGFEEINLELWDHNIETSLSTNSGKILFLGCCDDREFGALEVSPGSYNVVVLYGGQNSVHEDGTSEDHYLVRVSPK